VTAGRDSYWDCRERELLGMLVGKDSRERLLLGLYRDN